LLVVEVGVELFQFLFAEFLQAFVVDVDDEDVLDVDSPLLQDQGLLEILGEAFDDGVFLRFGQFLYLAYYALDLSLLDQSAEFELCLLLLVELAFDGCDFLSAVE